MHLALLGGTGRTGRLLIDIALDQGHTLRVLARDPTRLHRTHPHLHAITGDARDAGDLQQLMQGCEAVLSALGPVPHSPDDTMTLAAQHLTRVLAEHGVRRLITLTGAGVPHPGDTPTVPDRLIRTLLRLTQPRVLDDAIRHADIIRASTLDWTIVRAPRLTDGPVKPVRSGRVGTIRPVVTRASVAHFMLAQLAPGTPVRQAPAISN
ncbi:NAD(P)-dependent oxidoreductase [Deinococcus sonorensis]|uniref:NAD(P)H-binding protein n=2 Tax=Deinococcus sonorensis TaxID=309891 RepID=A0AAU7U6G3_9DEIO